MNRLAAGLLYSLLISLVLATPASATKRVALVIGNAPANSANGPIFADRVSKLATTLRSYGFDVVEGINTKSSVLHKHIKTFKNKLHDADVAMLFYAGRGSHDNYGSYIMPIGTKSSELKPNNQFSVQGLLKAMKNRQSRHNLVVLDAYHMAGKKLGSSGLKPGFGALEGASDHMLLTYNNSRLSARGTGKAHITKALLQRIAKKRFKPVRLASLMKQDVYYESGGREIPWISGSLPSTFEFMEDTAPPIAFSPNLKNLDDFRLLSKSDKKLHILKKIGSLDEKLQSKGCKMGDNGTRDNTQRRKLVFAHYQKKYNTRTKKRRYDSDHLNFLQRIFRDLGAALGCPVTEKQFANLKTEPKPARPHRTKKPRPAIRKQAKPRPKNIKRNNTAKKKRPAYKKPAPRRAVAPRKKTGGYVNVPF